MSVKIITNDGVEFNITKDMATMSITIRNLLDDIEDHNAAIPLPAINSKIMDKINEFCIKELAILSDQTEATRQTNLKEWHATFTNMEPKLLNDVLMAANYLDIKTLFDCCCQKVADLVKEKSVEELREIFGIVNDFTPEEEAKIKEETAWADED